jgi:hypothetical protein
MFAMIARAQAGGRLRGPRSARPRNGVAAVLRKVRGRARAGACAAVLEVPMTQLDSYTA